MSGGKNVAIPDGSRIKETTGDTLYDVIILGAGPAGLTAAVYAIRKGMDTALLTSNIGGQVNETSGIENYMGYRHIEGTDLIDRFFDQIRQFSISFRQDVEIKSVFKENGILRVKCGDKSIYSAKTVIIATGKSARKLNVPGETEYTGKGVAYCSICDAPLYAGLKVAVVGGGNSALESAIDLCRIAKEVHIIQALTELTADKILIDRLNEFDNFTIHFDSRIVKIAGDTLVRSVSVSRLGIEEVFTLDVDGVFVSVGMVPNTSFAAGLVEMNEFDEIVVNCNCETSVKGVFAAGDVTSVPVKQIIVAAGEGAKAAIASYQYLLKLP